MKIISPCSLENFLLEDMIPISLFLIIFAQHNINPATITCSFMQFTQQNNHLLAVFERGNSESSDMVKFTTRNGKCSHLVFKLSFHLQPHMPKVSFATFQLLYQLHAGPNLSHSSAMHSRSLLMSFDIRLVDPFLQYVPGLAVHWV